MRTMVKAGFTFTLLFINLIVLLGCSETQLEVKARLTRQIAEKLPPDAQLVAESSHRSPLYFKAWDTGLVYYVGNGEICLTVPLNAMDTITLNRWNPPEMFTEIKINDKSVYRNPDMRCGDNRFYFIAGANLQTPKPDQPSVN